MKTLIVISFRFLALILILTGLALQPLLAQQISVGGHLAAQMDTEEDFTAIGADALIGLNNTPVLISPAFTYFIQNNITEFQIDANVLYPLDLEGDPQLEPFFAGGVALEHYDFRGHSDTKPGLNVAAGAQLRLKTNDKLKPYLQGQYTMINDFFNRFLVSVGVRFNVTKK